MGKRGNAMQTEEKWSDIDIEVSEDTSGQKINWFWINLVTVIFFLCLKKLLICLFSFGVEMFLWRTVKIPCQLEVNTTLNISMKEAGYSSTSTISLKKIPPLLPIVGALTVLSLALSIACLVLLLTLLRMRNTYTRKLYSTPGLSTISDGIYQRTQLPDMNNLPEINTILETDCQFSETTRKLSQTLPKIQGFPTFACVPLTSSSHPIRQINNDLELGTFTINPL